MSMRMRRSLLGGVAVFCLALLVAGGALVAERDTQWAALQLDPEWSQFRSYVTQQDLGYHNDAWQAFEAANPGEWKTEWDMRTGFPHVVYGPGLDTGYSAMDAGTAASVAFDLIEEHGPLFGVESFDLDMDVSHAGNTWYVDMGLVHDAIPFDEQSRFAVRIKDNGVVVMIKTYDVPKDIELSHATITAADAVDTVMASLQNGGDATLLDSTLGTLEASDPELFYIVDGFGTGRLVWRFEIRNNNLVDPFGKEYFVHARDSVQVYKINDLIHYDHGGNVKANVLLGAPSAGATPNTNLEDARVTITAGGGGTQFTDANGDFNFVGGTGSRTIRSQLDGRWSNVQNQAGGDAQLNITANEGNNFNFNHPGAGELGLAETTAFYWTIVSHDYTSPIMGNNGLEFELTTNVNINSSCNAFWDGSSINFYQAGGGCPNTAYADVVAHEYGHGVDAGRGGILNGGLSEGFGDSLAMGLTDQSCTGRDFFGPGTCLRDGENVRLWPATECGGSVHCQGEVYGGFTWQMTKNLKVSLGQILGRQKADELILLPAVANSGDIPDAVLDTFVADDDNGNLNDGTPNYNDIAAAALSRNLPFPEIPSLTWTFPNGLPDIFTPGGTTIRVDVAANRETPVDGTGTVTYRFNGGSFVTIPMQSVGVNQYEANIPSQNCFDQFDYYFNVNVAEGGTSSDPFGAPASTYSAIVAQDVFTAFEDDFNTNTGWTVTNTAITDGAFVRGVPAGDGTRRDPTTDFDGSGFCFLTDNVAGNSDVDGGPTTITSPLFDLSNDGVISFAYWHSNDDGDDPFRCEVSVNGGSTWTTAFTQTGGSDGWQTHQFTLSDVALPSSTVRVRFSSTDNPNDSITESAVDAFKAQRIDCTEEQNLLLSQTELVRGSPATFSVFGASPNSTVVIHWTKGGVDPDMGPCPPEYGGLCLDLIGNVKTLITRTSNSQGQVQFTRTVPPSIPQLTVHTQAVNVQGAGGSESVKSNSVTDTIQ